MQSKIQQKTQNNFGINDLIANFAVSYDGS